MIFRETKITDTMMPKPLVAICFCVIEQLDGNFAPRPTNTRHRLKKLGAIGCFHDPGDISSLICHFASPPLMPEARLAVTTIHTIYTQCVHMQLPFIGS